MAEVVEYLPSMCETEFHPQSWKEGREGRREGGRKEGI
jgi:hypothetical protein